MARSKPTNPLAWILIGVFTVLFLVGAFLAYHWGKRNAEEELKSTAIQFDHKLDSLYEVEIRLRGSLDSLKSKRNEATRIRTVYKTVYDTIQVKIVTVEIIDGLNSILSVPIPAKEQQ
jgi:flagellar basal body-associated protein FliL